MNEVHRKVNLRDKLVQVRVIQTPGFALAPTNSVLSCGLNRSGKEMANCIIKGLRLDKKS